MVSAQIVPWRCLGEIFGAGSDYDKRTALMLACAEGNMDAAVTLMQARARLKTL